MKKFFALALLLLTGITTFAQVDSVDVEIRDGFRDCSYLSLRYIGTKEGTNGMYMVRVLVDKKSVINLYQDQVMSFRKTFDELCKKTSEWENKFDEYVKYNDIDSLYKQMSISFGKLNVVGENGREYEIEPEVYFKAEKNTFNGNTFSVIFIFKQGSRVVRTMKIDNNDKIYQIYKKLEGFHINQALKKKLATIDEIFN